MVTASMILWQANASERSVPQYHWPAVSGLRARGPKKLALAKGPAPPTSSDTPMVTANLPRRIGKGAVGPVRIAEGPLGKLLRHLFDGEAVIAGGKVQGFSTGQMRRATW